MRVKPRLRRSTATGPARNLKFSMNWMMSSSVMSPLCGIGAFSSSPDLFPCRFKMSRLAREMCPRQFAATRFYLCDATTSPPFVMQGGVPLTADARLADGAFPALLYRPGLGARVDTRSGHDARPGQEHGQR